MLHEGMSAGAGMCDEKNSSYKVINYSSLELADGGASVAWTKNMKIVDTFKIEIV